MYIPCQNIPLSFIDRMMLNIIWKDIDLWKVFSRWCCCCSVAKLCTTLCDPMDCIMPVFPDFHCLPEFAQTHVHWVCDAIQTCHPLPPSSLLAISLSQHQGLFQWVSFSHQVDKVLGASASVSVLLMNMQRWFPLGLTSLIFLLSKERSSVLSSTTVQKHQCSVLSFFMV